MLLCTAVLRRFSYVGLLIICGLISACEGEPTEPASPLPAQPSEAPLFKLLSPEQTGITFENALPENDQFNILSYEYFYNGGGVAIGDVNGDKLPDIVFIANLVANRIYLNQGNMRFVEAAKQTGFVSRGGWKTGVTMADVNADGHLDIYICRSGNLGEAERRNELFINQGDGTFRDEATAYGLDDPGYSTHATFFDYDRDGDLDCFVLNHALKPSFSLTVAQVKQQRDPFFGDHLYRNENGKFTDVSADAGIVGNPIGFGLSVTVEDFDRDGWPDLFVANDYTEQDYFYRNNRNGTFTETLNPAMAHTSHFSMGSDAGDVNGDGWPDLMVLDMLPEDNYGQKILKGPDNYNKYQMQVSQGFYHQQMRNTLQLNMGRGLEEGQAFSEIGQLYGLSNTDWSWSTLMADYDNDGDLDIHVTNGYVRASTHLDFVKYDYPAAIKAAQEAGRPLSDGQVSKKIPTIHKPNVIFRNDGPENGFAQVTRAWGLQRPSYSQGAAFGDLDLDGDLDLVVNNLKATAFVYENQSDNASLIIDLAGPPANPDGVGAAVIAWVDGTPQRRFVMPARGYQSSVEPVAHIGLGDSATVEKVEVIWPTGEIQEILSPASGRITITWEAGLPAYSPETFSDSPLNEAGFTHVENLTSEFDVQPLMPFMLGRMGPCLSVHQIDERSGEICVGGGPGQAAVLKTYSINAGTRNWCSWSEITLPGTVEAEITDVLHFDADGDGDEDLYLVAGGNEAGTAAGKYQDILLIRDGNSFRKGTIPVMNNSGGCVAAGDADGDGDLDLFVGGRISPGKYPMSPASMLLLNDGAGNFVDQSQGYGLNQLGMISDASWADINGDGQAELVLLGEWLEVSVFEVQDGKLVNANERWGLAGSSGLWTDLEVVDLDGDGDLDLLTGNMGTNSQMTASASQPMRMYAADFDKNGSVDPIITHYLDGKEVPVAARDELLGHLRYLQKKFPRYENYARAEIHTLLTPQELAAATRFDAKELRSGWWEQQNGTFTFHPWPRLSQASPVLSQNIVDLNGDGKLDVLLAGNFYPVRAELGRYDASGGYVLLSTPSGDFTLSSDRETGGSWLTGDIRDTELIPIGNGEFMVIAARNNQNWLWGKW